MNKFSTLHKRTATVIHPLVCGAAFLILLAGAHWCWAADQEKTAAAQGTAGEGQSKPAGEKADATLEQGKAAAAPEKKVAAKPGETAAIPKTAAEWRYEEPLGLGLGYFYGNSLGLHVFADYNIQYFLQLHVDASSQSMEEVNTLGVSNTKTDIVLVTASLRYFLDDAKGLFVGAGTGIGNVTQTSASSGDTTSTGTFTPVFLDVGWQGWSQYFVTINLQLGSVSSQQSEDKTKNIPNVNNARSMASQDFKNAMNNGGTGLFVGVGWFFGG